MKKIYYELEQLTPRQFEVLAANYAYYHAPQYDWHLTKKTGDYNRDFEALTNLSDKWGEAKHTKDPDKSISKSRWDPTLLSAQLKNSIDIIFLITCGRIPLEYVVRAEHFKDVHSMMRIAYINRFLLDIWLNDNQIKFSDFEEDSCNLNDVMKDIQSNNPCTTSTYKPFVGIFSEFSNNMLEPQRELEPDVIYELNIVTFVTQNDYILHLEIPTEFTIIDQIVLKELSYINVEDKKFDANTREFCLNIGYNQILIHGFFNHKSSATEQCIYLRDIHNTMLQSYSFNINKQTHMDNIDSHIDIIDFENMFETCVTTGQNHKFLAKHLNSNDLIRNYKENPIISGYYCYSFNDSAVNNAKKLCQLAGKVFFNIDLTDSNEKAISLAFNTTIKYYDFLLLDLVMGSTSAIFALNAIHNILCKEENTKLLKTLNSELSPGTIFYLEGLNYLSKELYSFMKLIVGIFSTNRNSSIAVIDMKWHKPISEKEETNLNVNNSINNNSVEPLIDELLKDKNYAQAKYEELLEQADVLYKKTDFYSALYLYNFIYKNDNIKSIQVDLIHNFRYADCLNHCGSMKKSKTIFEDIAKPHKDQFFNKTMLEAQTEVFNIRFWQMDTEGLVADIDRFISKHYSLLRSNHDTRDLYSYYNCLNRKMVTQYLIGDYSGAEETYAYYVREVDEEHKNYLAFAHMDSARGLYKKDIMCAQERMEKAYHILNDLYKSGKEQRRFYDCVVEIEYIDFVIKYNKRLNPDTEKLEAAILNVKINGYRNMLLKCYLKLATCHLALYRIDEALNCLEFVKNNCDFTENPRVEFLYNSIMSNLCAIQKFKVIHGPIAEDFAHLQITLKFNCDMDGTILFETRIW